MVAILQQMGYLTKAFDQAEKSLFDDAWSLIARDDWVSLKNLTTLLVAVEKIYIAEKH